MSSIRLGPSVNRKTSLGNFLEILHRLHKRNLSVSSVSFDHQHHLRFVPKCKEPLGNEVERLNEFVQTSRNMFVLSGAGISTESGIPDYRSEGVGLYAARNHKPIEYSEFLKSSEKRKMYWARNYVSWPIFSSFKPNLNHRLLAEWERARKVYYHVTQNVDGLLIKAGCRQLTELHGTSYFVKCLNCHFYMSREAMQLLIKSYNPNWSAHSNDLSPDNDVYLSNEQIKDFVIPKCPKCSHDKLKPDLVFFGDNIPKRVVDLAREKLSNCDALLALGTSIQVYSAYRIILQAKEMNIPIAIISIGPTRADSHAAIKVEAKCSDVLKRIRI